MSGGRYLEDQSVKARARVLSLERRWVENGGTGLDENPRCEWAHYKEVPD